MGGYEWVYEMEADKGGCMTPRPERVQVQNYRRCTGKERLAAKECAMELWRDRGATRRNRMN